MKTMSRCEMLQPRLRPTKCRNNQPHSILLMTGIPNDLLIMEQWTGIPPPPPPPPLPPPPTEARLPKNMGLLSPPLSLACIACSRQT